MSTSDCPLPKNLEITVDKFIFRVPTDRRYSQDGLWVMGGQSQEPGRVRIGITDYLQQRSGDATFVTVRPVGTILQTGDEVADLETIKVTIALPSPLAGTIVTINEALELSPELVNQSPHDLGWLAEIEAKDEAAARSALLSPGESLSPEEYVTFMKAEAEDEVRRT